MTAADRANTVREAEVVAEFDVDEENGGVMRARRNLARALAAAEAERDEYKREWDKMMGRALDCLERRSRAEADNTRLREALEAGRNYLRKISDPMCPPAIRQAALDVFDERTRAALTTDRTEEAP